MMEHDMPGRMAGTVAYVEGQFANGDLVAVDEPPCRFERLTGDSIFRAVLREAVDPEAVFLVRSLDLDSELLREDAGAAAMVDVAVGQQDLLDGDVGLLGRGLEAREVAARIDECCPHSPGAPQKRAILVERRDRDDRCAQRRLGCAHFQGSVADHGLSVAIAGGSFFIDAATASAPRSARRTLPPASFERFWSLHPRRISSANRRG